INQCQKLEHMLESGRSSAPSAGTFDDEFDIDSDFWEQSPFTDDFATPKPKKETKPVVTEEEKPVQGLLLIVSLHFACLLVKSNMFIALALRRLCRFLAD